MKGNFSIMVIILTYNAEMFISNQFNLLLEQTYKDNMEIIVIDSSSKDRTVEIAKKYADKVVLISKEEFDHGGTRTKAGKMAKGDNLFDSRRFAL